MLAIAIAMISAADREPQLAASDDVERAGAGVEPGEEAVLRRPRQLVDFDGRRLDVAPELVVVG